MSHGNVLNEQVANKGISCFSGCMDKIRLTLIRHEKTALITGICLAVLAALIAIGLVGMAGAASSAVLLVVGLSVLVISFVLLALNISRLIMKQHTEKKEVLESKLKFADKLTKEMEQLGREVKKTFGGAGRSEIQLQDSGTQTVEDDK